MSSENLYLESPIIGNVLKVRILVVDAESSSLEFITALLMTFNYQVTSTRDPYEALTILHMNEGKYDLVLLDIFMPSVNGVDLQKVIEDRFQIPVILMTDVSDKKKLVEETGLEEGTIVMTKPVSISEFHNLWHFVASRVKAMKSLKRKKQSNNNGSIDKNQLSGDLNNDKGNSPISEKDEDEAIDVVEIDNSSNNPKKRRMIWTNALHNKFVNAIKNIGFEKAIPTKILEYMAEPGLTRNNVASHLQKYRILLQNICEAYAIGREETDNGILRKWNQNPFRLSSTWDKIQVTNSNLCLTYELATEMFQQLGKTRKSDPKKKVVAKTRARGSNVMKSLTKSNKNNCKSTYEIGESSGSSQGLRSLLNRNAFFDTPVTNSGIRFMSAPNGNNNSIGNQGGDAAACDASASAPVQFPLSNVPRSSVTLPTVISTSSNGTQAQSVSQATPGFRRLSGGFSSGVDMANDGTFVTSYQGVQNQVNGNVRSLQNFVSGSNMMMQQPPPPLNMSNFAGHSSAINMPSNFVEQRSMDNDVSAFMNQQSYVSNMSNLLSQPATPMFNNFNFDVQSTSAMTSTSNSGVQPTAHVTSMPNFGGQSNALSSMSNVGLLSNSQIPNFAAQLTPTSITPDFVAQPYASTMASMSSFATQHSTSATRYDFDAQPYTPMGGMYNISNSYMEPQPYVVNVPNFAEQQSQSVDAVMDNMSNFVVQQPQFDAPYMSNSSNISTVHQQSLTSNNMDNFSITPEQVQMFNNLNSTSTQQLAVGNQENNYFSSSKDIQQALTEGVQGSNLMIGTSNQLEDWTKPNNFDDHLYMDQMDELGVFFSSTDAHNDISDAGLA